MWFTQPFSSTFVYKLIQKYVTSYRLDNWNSVLVGKGHFVYSIKFKLVSESKKYPSKRLDLDYNVMVLAQKNNFMFWRNGRVHILLQKIVNFVAA